MEILRKTIEGIEKINSENMTKKEKELNSLLKTPKGLGKIEDLAIQLEGIKENYTPDKKIVSIALICFFIVFSYNIGL